MERVEIREAGLLIRPWQPSDAAAVFRACQDPEIQRWTSVPRPYLHEHAEGFVTAGTAGAWAAGSAAPMGVFDPGTDELLGSCGLVDLDLAGRTGEIGYWTAPWARGQAVATRATRGVARWALQTLRLTRLVWRAELGNHASRLVAERAGFRVEGILRHSLPRPGGTELVDAWIGSLLPGELREADRPADPRAALRTATLSAPQPVLPVSTPAGEKITLRAPAEADLDAIVRACRDPESVRWTTVPDPYGPADAAAFAFGYAPQRWLSGTGAIFAIADAHDRFAGSIGIDLDYAGVPGVGDVGFLVAPWARGHGYASAALRALCRWGFTRLGLDRIEWRAYVGNDASRRVAERAGFTIEGIARAGYVQRGQLRDAWTGALLRGDIA